MILLHLAEVIIKPPSRYPDLFPALFAIYGAINFLFAYLYGLYWLWSSNSDTNNTSNNIVEEMLQPTMMTREGKAKVE